MANGKRKGLKVGVQFHKASGQFSKIIGKALGRDGLPRPKLFYLGTDEAGAVIQASQLKARWKALQADGKTVWDEEPSYQSERAMGEATPVERQGMVTVGNAAKMYLDHLEQQYRGGQFCESHFISQRYLTLPANILNDVERTPRLIDRLQFVPLSQREQDAVYREMAERPAFTILTR